LSNNATGPEDHSGPVTQLVFFDLDETITRHDTLLPYAMGLMLRKRPWRLPLLATVIPSVVSFLTGRVDEGRVKEAFIKATLRGTSRAALEAWTLEFVLKVIADGTFPTALKKIKEHRKNGDYLILMSASTDLYVPAIAEALGFQETICTQVRWNGDRLDGTLTTPNRKGAEKARCFAQARAQHPGLATVAYGNSSTDLPHLQLADQGVLVNGSDQARRAAQSLANVVCEEWQ
jgi:HAD superfamily hydrolase (TIGR01490 family)